VDIALIQQRESLSAERSLSCNEKFILLWQQQHKIHNVTFNFW